MSGTSGRPHPSRHHRRLFAGFLGALLLLAGGTAEAVGPRASNRLIVELSTPPASAAAGVAPAGGRFRADAAPAVEQQARIAQEQSTFVSALAAALPGASTATYRTESGQAAPLRYSLVFNGLAVEPGTTPTADAERALLALPGVKAVYCDWAHEPNLYASLPLIGAPALWAAAGGSANAGAGVKIASMDGGVHHAAPMFDGTGYSYPLDFPKGDAGNTNGKIIVSRAYFRASDPAAPGDGETWPGVSGTSHGVHTAGIAAGNPVAATYLGTPVAIGGTAPAAWVMSYRVFYPSVTGDQSFYTAEGIKALEDIVADGADVVNNSWGAGPTSTGGALDPLDTALLNAAAAGVFVSMSAGNAGPGPATLDHPSAGYVTVAATSTDGTFKEGRLGASAPEPVDAALADIAFLRAQFGGSVAPGATLELPYLPAAAVGDGTNDQGCSPFPTGAFAGKAAIVRRGSPTADTCFFDQKVFNAQEAGALFVVVYNNAGESLITMSAGTPPAAVTIPAVFVAQAAGEGLVSWHAAHPAEAALAFDAVAHQVGNAPDRVASFSSRGPGVGNVLKPDLAAPGVNIVSQGYAAGAAGEDRHLGYGQVSGTSMAAPHVAGAAAVLRQIHLDWTPATIKSALMSTAKYLEVYNEDGSPAQPLDMGAGRIDLARAADPGVILDPPSLGFGPVRDLLRELAVTVTNVSGVTETYEVDTLGTRDGFAADQLLLPLPGFSVDPASLTLAPGESATLYVTFNPSTADQALGDQQGYVVLEGDQGHQAHFPVWARLVPAAGKPVLLVDNDRSSVSASFPDYRPAYGAALQSLGYEYDAVNVDAGAPIPDGAKLSTYRAVVYFSGDNFTAGTLSPLAMDRLTEYANNGGAVVTMGQDATWVFNGSFFAESVLGAWRLDDSVSGEAQPTQRIVPLAGAPAALAGLSIDVGDGGDGSGSQRWIDELSADPYWDPGYDTTQGYLPLLRYPDGLNDRVVAVGHREQPSLERRGVTFLGRTVHASFGLEGVNNDVGGSIRAQVLGALLDLVLDAPTVTLKALVVQNDPRASAFVATLASPVAGAAGVKWRWDFGDGTAYRTTLVNRAKHVYAKPGTYTVTVEVTDDRGNRALGSFQRRVGELSVTILPTAARAAGARWRLDRSAWRTSGAVIRGVPVGLHTVEFLPVAGWTTPVKKTVRIRAGARKTLTGTYLQ